MREFIDACFAGSHLPATVLMLVLTFYWLTVIVGVLDFDLFDFDFEMDMDTGSIVDLGFIPLRFLNLGDVPLMLWLSTFGINFWLLSMVIDQSVANETTLMAVQAIARNVGISVLLTKVITNPLRGKFVHVEPNRVEDLIGNTCVITTIEATTEFGQAEYKTESAPLLLNIRLTEGTLGKGDLAEIVDYDSNQHIYYIKRANPET